MAPRVINTISNKLQTFVNRYQQQFLNIRWPNPNKPEEEEIKVNQAHLT